MVDPTATAITPYARVSYAQGWAMSAGPMTDRVKAGCTAAIELAIEHAHDPAVLENTLRLGHLEGTWAAVYQRREQLVTKHVKTITAAWRRAAHILDLRVAVRRFRDSLGLTETTDPDNTAHRRLVANAIATAVSQATAGDGASPPDRDTIITAISTSLKDAEAEGTAAATMVGADQLGIVGVDFNLAFTDAHTALADLGSYWGTATGWLGKIVTGNATDLGGRLSALAADDATFDDMLTAAEDVMTGADVRAVSAIVDLAMGQSFSRGALALYARQGVRDVDFITAGGSRVCARCLDIESNNPWDRNAVPAPPVHVSCRCSISASNPMQGLTGLLTKYMTAA